MATTNFTSLTDLILENYGPTVKQSFAQAGLKNGMIDPNSILGRVQDADMLEIGPGENSDRYMKDWAVDTAATTASTINGTDSFPAAQTATFDDAKMEWKRVVATVDIDNLTMLALRNGKGLRGSFAPLARRINRAMLDIISKVESGLASDGTGNSGKDVTGCKAYLSTGNTYATIDQSANAWWRAVVVAASSASISETLMNSLMGTLEDRKAIDPSMEVWVNRVQYNKLWAIYNPNIAYVSGGSNAGFSELVHPETGVPIRKVASVPTDEAWAIKRSEFSVRFLDHEPDSDAENIGAADEAVMNELGFPFGFELVDQSTDIKRIIVKAYVNAAQESPFFCGALTGLAT